MSDATGDRRRQRNFVRLTCEGSRLADIMAKTAIATIPSPIQLTALMVPLQPKLSTGEGGASWLIAA